MHAHNIDTETFHKAQKLFQTVNRQLDTEIGFVMNQAGKRDDRAKTTDYNKALREILQMSEAYTKTADLLRQTMTPELLALQELARRTALDPNYIKLQEIANAVALNYPKIDIPDSSIRELQQALQQWQSAIDPYGKQAREEKDEIKGEHEDAESGGADC